jgi:glycosyltransferase involved in cell wall biosynthesis
MRIALINDWFSEKMGYSENALSKALASIGHDVHVITSDAQPYFDAPEYRETYEPFLGPGVVPTGDKFIDGYNLHRLPHGWFRGRMRIVGVRSLLRRLRPAIVQTLEVYPISTLEAAICQPFLGYRMFAESHVHASVLGPASPAKSAKGLVADRVVYPAMAAFRNSRIERCYAISPDAAEIAEARFGIDRGKIDIVSLGVDTQLFTPLTPAQFPERRELRRTLGFDDDHVVCIYTGRFTSAKGPQHLADAISRLVGQGEPFRGLFVGAGPASETRAIQRSPGCVVHPFVPTIDLPPLYRAADVGVWPKQESTSQLDAIACALPIILSDRVTVKERVEGNGFVYSEGDVDDLVSKLLALRSATIRHTLGRRGSERVRARFSWADLAARRAEAYELSRQSRL